MKPRAFYKSEPHRNPRKSRRTLKRSLNLRGKNAALHHPPLQGTRNPTPPPPNARPIWPGRLARLPYSNFTVGGATQGGWDSPGRAAVILQGVSRLTWTPSAIASQQLAAIHGGPSVRWARARCNTFQILRDGTVTNVQMTTSSGKPFSRQVRVTRDLEFQPVSPLPSNFPATS